MSNVFEGNATSKTIYVMMRDSTTLAGKTGLAFGTAGLKFYYTRDLADAVTITLVTQTTTAAWTSGGFVEVSSSNAPGLYRLDLPNAAIATGVNGVVVTWTGASTIEDGSEIALVGFDPTTIDKTGFSLAAAGLDPVYDASNGVETGLTLRGLLRLLGSVMFGKASGMATTTAVFRNAVADSKARVTATVDASGNRTAVTTDQT